MLYVFWKQVNRHFGCNGHGIVCDHEFLGNVMALPVVPRTLHSKLGHANGKVVAFTNRNTVAVKIRLEPRRDFRRLFGLSHAYVGPLSHLYEPGAGCH